jgi:outer membrane protein assembly factor BamD
MPKLDAFPSINNASLSRIGQRLATSIASVCILSSVALLSGCAGGDNDETAGWSQNKLYVEAKDAMDGGDNAKCVKYFEKLEARYPFGPYAQQSQINVAYCHWKDGELAQAITAVDRFLQLHPGHPSVDYAYYLKGLITFNDNMGFLGKLTGQDLSERDPRAARDAFEAFKTLTTRFPESKYTPDALDRMRYIVNSLADSDVNTARYYYRRGAYLAAINRAQRAITDYDRAPATEEALYILHKSYEALNMKDLSSDALRVLKLNFPESQILVTGKRTGADENKPSWWQIWRK